MATRQSWSAPTGPPGPEPLPGQGPPLRRRPPGDPPPEPRRGAAQPPPQRRPPGDDGFWDNAPNGRRRRQPDEPPPRRRQGRQQPPPRSGDPAGAPVPPRGQPRAGAPGPRQAPPGPPAGRAVVPPPQAPSRRGAQPSSQGRPRVPAPGAPSRQAPAAKPNRRGPMSSSGQRPATRGRQKAAWARLAPVYDVDGPRIRLGLAWFAVAVPAIALSTTSTALLYAVAGALSARQVVKAWKGESWQADAAAAAAGLPILGAIGGTGAAVAAMLLATCAAVAVGLSAPAAGLRGNVGRIAAAGIMIQATVPIAVAGAAMVVLRGEAELMTAVILFGLACAYEMGDFLVGSGSSNPVEGPMAGGAAVMVIGFPLALVLIPPFDELGVAMLAVTAAACPVGQWIASALLPRPDAHAPALRRIDTLLLLAPLWVIGTGLI